MIVLGGPGSGKTTALKHLAACLPPWARIRIPLLDEPANQALLDALQATDTQLVISTGAQSSPLGRIANALGERDYYHLATWNQDDVIEYLLSAHRDACPSVMARLKASGGSDFLNGIPELWAVVLDRMAIDESIGDVRTALRCELASRLDDSAPYDQIEELCLAAISRSSAIVLGGSASDTPSYESAGVSRGVELFRLVRHRPVTLLLAAKRIATIAEQGRPSIYLNHRLPRDLIQEASRLIGGNALAIDHLNDWVNRSELAMVQPIAASLLHAALPDWRPPHECRPRLHGAYLDQVVWPGLNLENVDLECADLERADLTGANLQRANLNQACLEQANLTGANLKEARLDHACLVRSNVQGALLTACRCARGRPQRG